MKKMKFWVLMVAVACALGIGSHVAAQPATASTSAPDQWRENYA